MSRPPAPTRLRVFAVEDDGAQVCWAHLAPGDTVLAAGASKVEVTAERAGAQGAAVIGGLTPATGYDLLLGAGASWRRVARFRTLPSPPGPLLYRFATLNDLHIGEAAFGYWGTLHEPVAVEPYPQRCARAALAEAVAWGAEAVVVKGDITDSGTPVQWAAAGRLLAGAGVPVHLVLGNHDT
ncbi:MAG: metallophosphoesterase, partial [Acidimicrobiales bacterium]